LLIQNNCYILIIPGFGIVSHVVSTFSGKPAQRNRKTLLWVKLSNSGNSLKLIVLNYIWKYISGWSNYSGIVTSYKMNENEIGYRGSKSILITNIVKEQRVDGNFCINQNPMQIWCTLMGFERNYQLKILSSPLQINTKHFSTFNSKPKMNPWFLTEFADGDSSFTISITKSIKNNIGWKVYANFQNRLNLDDLPLLLEIQKFFGGVGRIISDKKKTIVLNFV
jgi:hypothetical protein